ncbi:hypothetical protein [Rhizobium lusitanum]|uniref:hypothetical protein n=1 Tax=Rhizobium lusitanum TaxID=293958 RepID=UPI003F4AAF63
MDKTPTAKREQFIDELRSTPEGKAALEEAKQVAKALEDRFGHSDPRSFAEELEQRPELARSGRADQNRRPHGGAHPYGRVES